MSRRPVLTGLWLFATMLLLLPLMVMLVERPASAAGVAAPSGEAMPVGDLAGWRQVFTDDFTTDVPLGSFPKAVTTKWGVYVDGQKDTSRHGTYFPSKVVSVAGGLLNEYIHTENGVHMVASIVPRIPSKSLLYGRYAIRFRSDVIANYKSTGLLWPDSNVWPRDGEIDWPEANLNGPVMAYMHRQDATVKTDQDWFNPNADYAGWHTFVTEWSPTATTYSIDGVNIGTSTARIPNSLMHYVIQTETGLGGTIPADTAAGNVQIDWVAIWSRV